MIEKFLAFLGNERATNYRTLLRKLLLSYGNMGVNMSLKLYFLDAHLDRFLENCGAYSDEHGQQFHQEMLSIEQRFKGNDVTRTLSRILLVNMP